MAIAERQDSVLAVDKYPEHKTSQTCGMSNGMVDPMETPFLMDELDLRVTGPDRKGRNIEKIDTWFPTVADTSFIGVFRMALDGKMSFYNVALAALLDYATLEQMDEDDVFLHIHDPKDRKLFLEILTIRGFVKDFLCSIRSRTGCLKAVLISAALTKNEIYGTVLDISEKKQANTKLRAVSEFSQKIKCCKNIPDICKFSSEYLQGFDCPNYIALRDTSGTRFKIIHAAFDSHLIAEAERYLGYDINEFCFKIDLAKYNTQTSSSLHANNVQNTTNTGLHIYVTNLKSYNPFAGLPPSVNRP